MTRPALLALLLEGLLAASAAFSPSPSFLGPLSSRTRSSAMYAPRRLGLRVLRASSGGSAGGDGGVNGKEVFRKMALDFASKSNTVQQEKLGRMRVLEEKMKVLMEASMEEVQLRMASQRAPSSAEQKQIKQRKQEVKVLQAELMHVMGIESMGEIRAGGNPSQLASASSSPLATAPLATSSAPVSRASPQEICLRFAVEEKDVGLVTTLVKEGVSVNAAMNDGATAFQFACQLGVPAILTSLVKAQGFDVNDVVFSSGSTPLLVVSSFGFTEAVRVLVKAGAEPDTVCVNAAPDGSLSKFTAMFVACQRGHFKVNPQPLTLNPNRWTPNPKPSILNPQPSTLKPQLSNLEPQTSNRSIKP